MEPSDMTIRVLQEIRDDIRGMRGEQVALRADFRTFAEQASARFEVIETTLRDLAEQMVMLSRGVKVALESKGRNDDRVDELERRVRALEAKKSP